MNRDSRFRDWSSKIAKPEDVRRVSFRTARARGSEKWWKAREKRRKGLRCGKGEGEEEELELWIWERRSGGAALASMGCGM